MRHDAGGIVVGWLTRVTIVLAVLGIVAFETLSILVVRMNIQDTASQAADDAQTSWSSAHNPVLAYTTAETTAEQAGATIPQKSFVINPDGSVHFVIEETARTLVLHDIKPLAKLAYVRTTYHAPAVMGAGSAP